MKVFEPKEKNSPDNIIYNITSIDEERLVEYFRN